MKQDGKLNFVVVIASDDRLKEVMLEPPKVAGKAAIATNRAAESDDKSNQNLTQVNVSKAKLGNDK
jgi:hypothetical protein